MDLRSLEKRERRKTITAWILISFAIAVFVILWTSEKEDAAFMEYIEQCVEVLENKHIYNPADVEECKRVIQEILRSQDTFKRLQT